MIKSDIKNLNQAIAKSIYENYSQKNKYKKLIKLDASSQKCYLTIETYSCFLRFYIGSSIDVYLRLNTINSASSVEFSVYAFNESSPSENNTEELEKYKREIYQYIDFAIFSALTMPYAFEHRIFPVPLNFTEEEAELYDSCFCNIWEKRILQPVHWGETSMSEWLRRCAIETPKIVFCNAEDFREEFLKNKKAIMKSPVFENKKFRLCVYRLIPEFAQKYFDKEEIEEYKKIGDFA